MSPEQRVAGYAFLEALAARFGNGQMIVTFHQGRIVKIQTPSETRISGADDMDVAFNFKPRP